MTTGTIKYYNKRKEWNNNERVRFVKDKMFDSRSLPLYGKVDQEMDPVVYEFSFNKALVGSTSRTEAQDFVVDAFDAFRGDIQDAYNTSLAYPQGFYTRYQPVIGHISVRELYRQRLYKIIAIFVNDYLSDLYISKATADEGPTLKRFRPRARGRAGRINKRTSHLVIELTTADGEL